MMTYTQLVVSTEASSSADYNSALYWVASSISSLKTDGLDIPVTLSPSRGQKWMTTGVRYSVGKIIIKQTQSHTWLQSFQRKRQARATTAQFHLNRGPAGHPNISSTNTAAIIACFISCSKDPITIIRQCNSFPFISVQSVISAAQFQWSDGHQWQTQQGRSRWIDRPEAEEHQDKVRSHSRMATTSRCLVFAWPVRKMRRPTADMNNLHRWCCCCCFVCLRTTVAPACRSLDANISSYWQ